jgi:hypothetical protein
MLHDNEFFERSANSPLVFLLPRTRPDVCIRNAIPPTEREGVGATKTDVAALSRTLSRAILHGKDDGLLQWLHSVDATPGSIPRNVA